jgi:hypothetical protein
LKTRNRRLETITSLLIKTLVNLEKEVEERRFYHNTNNTDTQMLSKNKQTNPFGRLTLQGMDDGWLLPRWFCEIIISLTWVDIKY